jgi:hypothetical protein
MNPDLHIADAIAAAALVLAILVALYTLWLGDVTAALDLRAKPDPDDRVPQRKQVTRALLTKALPLSAATIAGACILFPRSRAIICQVHLHSSDWDFDDVKALFVLTETLLILLGIVAIVQSIRLLLKRISLG